MTTFKPSDMHFVPLGGSDEIGMNANLYHFDSSWLMVDLGISFPDETMTGADVVLPDISFIEKRRDSLCGLVLTHAHEDHFGAIPYLWDRLGCPIYGSPFTLAYLKAKLEANSNKSHIPMHEIKPGEMAQIGPFSVEAIAVAHSIPDSLALCIRSDAGTVLHTGDWKFDKSPGIGSDTDRARLTKIGEEGVLAMVGDSTNSMIPGTGGSEAEVETGLRKVIASASGRIAISCFASNVARIRSIALAAHENGKSVVPVGRGIERAIDAALKVGYLRDVPNFVSEDSIDRVPREELVILCTGTQGEPNAAMAKIASGKHFSVKLEKNDTVVYSSSAIPGNEPAITRVQEKFVRRGIKVVTDKGEALVHVSGHPCRDEMTEMYAMVRPRVAIPVHGTALHLQAHAELARSCQVAQTIIPENGTIIRLASAGASDTPAAIIDGETVDTGLLTHDRGRVVDLNGDTMSQRRKLLWNGIVTASVVMDDDGALCAAPSLGHAGLVEKNLISDFIATASIAVEDEIEKLKGDDRFNDQRVVQVAEKAIKRNAKVMFQLHPMIHVHVMRVGEHAYDEDDRAVA